MDFFEKDNKQKISTEETRDFLKKFSNKNLNSNINNFNQLDNMVKQMRESMITK